LLFVRGGNLWQWANGQEAQLTTTCGCWEPRWSPAGDAILYIKRGESFADLYLADSGGQNARALTNNQSKSYQPETKEYINASLMLTGLSWVRPADGIDRIIYSNDQNEGFQLYMTTGLSGKPVLVNGLKPLGPGSEGAAISPDGITIAFDLLNEKTGTKATQIFLVNLNTGSYRAVTSEPGGAYDPAWSPDGQWLSYAVRQTAKPETNLWVMHPDGSGKQRLTEGGRDRGGVWSPDGDQFAFVRLVDNGFGLFVMDLRLNDGAFTAGKANRLGAFTDIDPASGISWAR
jgi:TolB protein